MWISDLFNYIIHASLAFRNSSLFCCCCVFYVRHFYYSLFIYFDDFFFIPQLQIIPMNLHGWTIHVIHISYGLVKHLCRCFCWFFVIDHFWSWSIDRCIRCYSNHTCICRTAMCNWVICTSNFSNVSIFQFHHFHRKSCSPTSNCSFFSFYEIENIILLNHLFCAGILHITFFQALFFPVISFSVFFLHLTSFIFDLWNRALSHFASDHEKLLWIIIRKMNETMRKKKNQVKLIKKTKYKDG